MVKKTTTTKPKTTRARKPTSAHHAKPKTAHTPKHEPVAEHKPAHKPVRVPASKNFYAVGKRKTAVAQAMVSEGNGTITVNDLAFESYFTTPDLRHVVQMPLVSIGVDKNINVKSRIHGGGIHAQAESLRHAIARALTAMNPDSRRVLKKNGFLTRDPRVKERKKPGLKRARRAPQFSKR